MRFRGKWQLQKGESSELWVFQFSGFVLFGAARIVTFSPFRHSSAMATDDDPNAAAASWEDVEFTAARLADLKPPSAVPQPRATTLTSIPMPRLVIK